jgi:hypothetical protein
MAYSYDDAPVAPPITLRAERDFGDVVNVTARLIADHFKPLMTALLVIAGVPLLVGFALTLFSGQLDLMSQWMEGVQGNDPDAMLDMFTGEYFAIVGISSLLSLVAGFLATAAGYAYVVLYREGHADDLTPGLLWEATKPLMGPVASVILVLIVGYIAFIIGAVLLAFIPFVGAIAAIVIGIWMIPIVFLLTAARIFDADNVLAAWKRTVTLVKGSWWRAFGLIVVLVIVGMVISVVASVPTWIAMGLMATDAGALGRVVFGIAGLASVVVTPLIYVIPSVAASVLYLTLLAEVEGPELYDRIEAIGLDEDDEEPLF